MNAHTHTHTHTNKQAKWWWKTYTQYPWALLEILVPAPADLRRQVFPSTCVRPALIHKHCQKVLPEFSIYCWRNLKYLESVSYLSICSSNYLSLPLPLLTHPSSLPISLPQATLQTYLIKDGNEIGNVHNFLSVWFICEYFLLSVHCSLCSYAYCYTCSLINRLIKLLGLKSQPKPQMISETP